MKKLALLSALILSATALNAQTIKGRVIDTSSEPIGYANVILYDLPDTTYVSGVITNSEGSFELQATPNDNAILEVSFVGYQAQYAPAVSEQTITLVTGDLAIDEIVVKGNRPLVSREVDRIIFDAKQLSLPSSNAIDVLRNTPGLLVSSDGDITVIGQGEVIVLVNDRELKMSGGELASMLASYNAEDIQQIEVMTTPPAKYSAEGNAGVVNIVLKKRIEDYIGGYVSNSYYISNSQYDGYTASLQYLQNRVSSFLNVSGGFGDKIADSTTETLYSDQAWATQSTNTTSNNYINAQAGVDIALPKQFTVGATFAYLNFTPDEAGSEYTAITESSSSALYNELFGSSSHDAQMDRFNANAHLDKKFGDSGRTMTFDVDYLTYIVSSDHTYDSSGDDDPFYYDNELDRTVDIYSSKLDFVLPYNKFQITAGAAFSNTKTDNIIEYNTSSIDAELDNDFLFEENIAAIYGDITFKIGDKTMTKVGLRGEYYSTAGSSTMAGIETVTNSDFNLFPTLFIRYVPSKTGVINASFSSRISRPSYSLVNPFTTYTNNYTVVNGNPYLAPERSYAAEVGYTYKNNLSVKLSYRYTDDVIGQIVSFDDDTKITQYQWDNYLNQQLAIFNVSYTYNKFSWMRNFITANAYTMKSSSSEYSVESMQYLVYMNNYFYLNKARTFTAQLSGQFQTGEKYADRTYANSFNVDTGIDYNFNCGVNLGFRVRTLLDNDNKGTYFSGDITQEIDNEINRAYIITVKYKFGANLKSNNRKLSNSALNDRL